MTPTKPPSVTLAQWLAVLAIWGLAAYGLIAAAAGGGEAGPGSADRLPVTPNSLIPAFRRDERILVTSPPA